MKRLLFLLTSMLLTICGFSQVVNYGFEANSDANPALLVYSLNSPNTASYGVDGFLPGLTTVSTFGGSTFFVKGGPSDGSLTLVSKTEPGFVGPNGNLQSLKITPSSAVSSSDGALFGLYNFTPNATATAAQGQIVGISFNLLINGLTGTANFKLATGNATSPAFYTGTDIPFVMEVAVNGAATTTVVTDKNGYGNSPNNIISNGAASINVGSKAVIEIYYNNSSTLLNFQRDQSPGASETLDSKETIVFINGIQTYRSKNSNNNTGTGMNSFMISGFNASAGSNITAYVDNILFANGNALAQVASQAAALPVMLTNFSAKPALNNAVNLSWSTSSEIANKGFRIERQSDEMAGKFQQIGFVGSKASEGGNSQTSLSYSFADVAPKLGAANAYRLVQEDLNGKLTYSEIRTVKMSSEGAMSIYPNPSNGNLTISRAASGKKMNLQVIDQNGRIINQINGITDPNYKLTNLRSGMYTLKLIYPETGEQSIQKVVVQK